LEVAVAAVQGEEDESSIVSENKTKRQNVPASPVLPLHRASSPTTLLHLCSQPRRFISVPVEAIPRRP